MLQMSNRGLKESGDLPNVTQQVYSRTRVSDLSGPNASTCAQTLSGRSFMQPDKAGCLQGPLTYIVNNCIMQRDSQASCPPFSAQMGRRFPSSFCKPPAEQRLDQESGVSTWSPSHHREPWPLCWALPVRQEEHLIGLKSAGSTKAQPSQSSRDFRGGLC